MSLFLLLINTWYYNINFFFTVLSACILCTLPHFHIREQGGYIVTPENPKKKKSSVVEE